MSGEVSSLRRVTIVGVGLVGGSIGLGMRGKLRSTRIVGVDRPGVLRRARRRGAIHRGTPSLARGVAGADLVILALPVGAILRILPRLGRLIDPRVVVTDVGSTKGAIVRGARAAGIEARFVGGHPMAGSERSGVLHAEAGVLNGASWILCPGARTRPEAVDLVRSLVARLGARPVILEARRHDEVVARLSHLPQIASVALVNAAVRGVASRSTLLAGPGFRQMTRLAGSSPILWASILKTNRRAILPALDDLVREISRVRSGLAKGAVSEFRRASRLRSRLLPSRRGRRSV
jgi:prephenate dehydrogenase